MSLSFNFGEIYHIKDELIVFPDNNGRNFKSYSRPVLILDITEPKSPTDNPLVTIAPITTKVHFKKYYDIDLPCALSPLPNSSLIRIGCLQSVCKVDLQKHCEGTIADECKDQVYDALMEKFGFDLFD